MRRLIERGVMQTPRFVGHLLAALTLLALASCSSAGSEPSPSAAGDGGGGALAGGGASGGTPSGGAPLGGASGSGGSDTGGAGGAPSAEAGSGPGGANGGGGAAQGGSGGSVAGSAGMTAGGSGGSPSSTEVTIVPDPSWTCGMPAGIAPPTLGKLVLRATLQLGETHDVGVTPLGHRRILDVKGGSLEGDGVSAEVMTGGLELELELSNGSRELEGLHVLRAGDGTLLFLRSCGVALPSEPVARIVPQLEVRQGNALSKWGDMKLVGTRTVDAQKGTVELSLYDVGAVTSPTTGRLTLTDPTGVPHQKWECTKASGSRGSSVFTETVTLGTSLSVGQGKNGSRNIIPITGGTVSGRLQGKVLPGGADYQLVSGSTQLDARYTLAGNDGELVLVRNCGDFGALVPVFEARTGGPYAFLNANEFLSSDPGSAAGGVSITFYERK